MRTSPHPHRVAVLVYDGVKLLDVAGPAEVFAEANRCGADYQIVLLSPTGAGVASSIGIKISVDGDAGSEPAPDTFLVAGGDIYPRTAISRDLVEATGTLATRSARVGSICTGAFILAAAGLLEANARPRTGKSHTNLPPGTRQPSSNPTRSMFATAPRTRPRA